MTHHDIPKSSAGYVCATDSFLSGWGRSEGLNNRLIFPCDSLEDVQAVLGNCESRPEFKRITHCTNKPKLDNWRNHYEVKTKEKYPNWFKKNFF